MSDIDIGVTIKWEEWRKVEFNDSRIRFPCRSDLKGLAGLYTFEARSDGKTRVSYIGEGGDLETRLGSYETASSKAPDPVVESKDTTRRVAQRLRKAIEDEECEVWFRIAFRAGVQLPGIHVDDAGAPLTWDARFDDTGVRLFAEGAAVLFAAEAVEGGWQEVLNRLRKRKGTTQQAVSHLEGVFEDLVFGTEGSEITEPNLAAEDAL
jgi:hypothetical protein